MMIEITKLFLVDKSFFLIKSISKIKSYLVLKCPILIEGIRKLELALFEVERS